MQELQIEDIYQKAYIRAKCFKGIFTHDISNLFHILSNSFELCEMLIKEGLKKEEILEYFKLIEEQINRGKKLVKNITYLSELEEFEMPLESIDLLNNLKNAVNFVQVNFPKRRIDIGIYSTTERLFVIANDLLLDVFENILMNSIIYNKSEIIEIDILISELTELNKQFIKLEFKDNGIGIDDNRKKEILLESHSKSKNSKGMGIGLSLVSNLINLYGGRMWIEDRIVGDSSKGSNFILTIPKINQNELWYYAYQKH
ncbi:MAG: sensor histidine kinase [Candidatus Lokiarchaeota archaeon]|nr:sensor histidine kinase [Candidatus Lokiarchaeota archaeon]